MNLRILLADDHIVVRQALRSLLEREHFTVVGEADDGQEAVRLAQELRPDVAVLDLSMPVLNGLEASRKILEVSPRTKTVILTVHAEDQYVLEALRAGISGYVLKSRASASLIEAIKEAFLGNVYLSPGISRSVVDAFLHKVELPKDPLTPREREVLQLVAEGKTTKEIAHMLGLTVKSAESYRARIMDKLDIHDTANLVRYAIRRGLIQP